MRKIKPSDFSCRECNRRFIDKLNLVKHENICLRFKNGESFLKYETRKRKDNDVNDKILPFSQPLGSNSEHYSPNTKKNDHLKSEDSDSNCTGIAKLSNSTSTIWKNVSDYNNKRLATTVTTDSSLLLLENAGAEPPSSAILPPLLPVLVSSANAE